MKREGIIRKVIDPTDWVSPPVIAHKKDGKMRVYMDLGRINDSLER